MPTYIFQSDWVCSECKFTLKHIEVKDLIDELEKEASAIPMDKDVYETTLSKYSHILHPNHHIMIDLEFTLVQLYGRPSSSTTQDAGLERYE